MWWPECAPPPPSPTCVRRCPRYTDQFAAIAGRLEQHYRDMQDMEFTIENGTLYMLQTRNGKRTAAAALKIAVDLVDEGMIDEREAVLRVDPKQLDALLHPQFDSDALKKAKPIGSGLAASPGAACGRVVFTAEDAKAWHERGRRWCWCGWRPPPRTSRGCRSPRASSPSGGA